MPQSVLPKALAQPGAYELLMAELQQQQAPPRPMFTPQQAAARVRGNNDLVGLGILGQLSGDQQMTGVGSHVFKQALGDRQERLTNRGIQDPLTGEVAVDPEYARQSQEDRRGKVLEQALRFEDQRQRAQERAELTAATEAERSQRAMDVAAMRAQGTATANQVGLARLDLIRAQTEAAQQRVSDARQKRMLSANKVKELADSARTKAEAMIKNLNDAEKMVGPGTTGLLGAASRNVPMTPAYDLNKLVDTIKAGIGFGELQQMRLESPTGGALGQVAVQELNYLQSTLGNLDTGQSPDRIKKNIRTIRQHYERIAKAMGEYKPEAHYEDPAISAPAGVPGASPGVPPAPGAASSTAPRRRLRMDASGNLVPVTP